MPDVTCTGNVISNNLCDILELNMGSAYLKRRYRIVAFIKEALLACIIAVSILAGVILIWWNCI